MYFFASFASSVSSYFDHLYLRILFNTFKGLTTVGWLSRLRNKMTNLSLQHKMIVFPVSVVFFLLYKHGTNILSSQNNDYFHPALDLFFSQLSDH